MKKPRTPRSTEIIFPIDTKSDTYRGPSGWGHEYQKVVFENQPIDITVRVGERAGVSIRINEDGDLTITNYGGVFDTQVPQNMRLTNSHPWTKVKE